MIREEERATIAREIHDDLGQSLTALKMDISWVKNNPEMGVEAKTAKFDMMLDLINSTIQTVKRIATELRPGILDDLGLVPAIEWQAAEFQSRFKIQCNVSINKSDVIVKDEISIAVFRIFQETLTNVARHSGATRVDIKLNFHVDNKLIMEIADNGVGIDEEQINSPKSLGLFGMRERVNILNGEMEIIGEQGKGTRVRAFIPVSIEELANSK
jgi:signal transduction histidine kinase